MKIYRVFDRNNKSYIGSTSRRLNTRLIEHKSNNKSFKGIDDLSIELLEECCDDSRYDRENHFINKFDTYNNGYNKSYASQGAIGCRRTKEAIMQTIETRRKNMPYFEIYKKKNPRLKFITNCYTNASMFLDIPRETVRKVVKGQDRSRKIVSSYTTGSDLSQ